MKKNFIDSVANLRVSKWKICFLHEKVATHFFYFKEFVIFKTTGTISCPFLLTVWIVVQRRQIYLLSNIQNQIKEWQISLSLVHWVSNCFSKNDHEIEQTWSTSLTLRKHKIIAKILPQKNHDFWHFSFKIMCDFRHFWQDKLCNFYHVMAY